MKGWSLIVFRDSLGRPFIKVFNRSIRSKTIEVELSEEEFNVFER